MKLGRRVLLIFCLMLAVLLIGCNAAEASMDYTVKVLLRQTEGIVINGDSLVEVKAGKMVTFKVSIQEGYVYVSNTANADYDPESGRLRLKEVIAPTTVDMIVVPEADAVHIGLQSNIPSTSVSASAYILGKNGDITVTAEESKLYRFSGWSVGGFIADGGELISTDRIATVYIDGNTQLYANYEEMPSYDIVYMLNGGRDTETGSDVVVVSNTYKSTFAMQQTLHHSGRFTKGGYSAIGYSTAPASYEEYESANDIPEFSNMGGVCFANDGRKELYVVWAKENPQSEFTFEEKNVSYANDSRYEWGNLKISSKSEKGIVITGWNGSGKLLVIPEKINGLPVLAIGKNAISEDIERLVIPRTVKNIEDGAFAGCESLREVVFFDSVVKVSDECFPKTVDTIVLNSQRLPVYSGTIEGSFSIKYERLRSLADQKKIVVISGSSTLNGLNSQILEELMPGYSVVNYGNNVANPQAFYIDVAIKYATEGDLIVHAPEFNDPRAMGEKDFHAKMFRGNEQCYDIFRDVDMTEYDDFWDSFQEFQIGDKGDSSLVPAIHQKGKEYQLETELNRYGDRSTVRSHVTGNFGGSTNTFGYDRLNYENLNELNKRANEKGATILMSFATRDQNVMSASALKQSECDRFTNDCAEKLDYPVISNVRTFILEHKYFFDSEWHPNDEGAALRSELLARDIKAYLANPDKY